MIGPLHQDLASRLPQRADQNITTRGRIIDQDDPKNPARQPAVATILDHLLTLG
jgi:hypothetical protein